MKRAVFLCQTSQGFKTWQLPFPAWGLKYSLSQGNRIGFSIWIQKLHPNGYLIFHTSKGQLFEIK